MEDLELLRGYLARQFCGQSQEEEEDKDKCVMCASEKVQAFHFRDDLSRKEYGISYLCQKCQDSVFQEVD